MEKKRGARPRGRDLPDDAQPKLKDTYSDRQGSLESDAYVLGAVSRGVVEKDDYPADPFEGLYSTLDHEPLNEEQQAALVERLVAAHSIDTWLRIRKDERERITTARLAVEAEFDELKRRVSKGEGGLDKARAAKERELADLAAVERGLIRSTVVKAGADPSSIVVSHALEVEDDRAGIVESVSKNLIIEPPFHPAVLEQIAQQNNQLGQLVNAMEINIDGTGWELVHEDKGASDSDEDLDAGEDDQLAVVEEERVAAAREVLEGFFKEPWPGTSFTTLRRRLRYNMETTGNAYMEVLRDASGEVVFARDVDPKLMRMVRLDDPVVVPIEIERGGRTAKINVSMRERRFVLQSGGSSTIPGHRHSPTSGGVGAGAPSGATASEIDTRRLFSTHGTKIIYFKEFGASRDLDMWTGRWAQPGEVVPIERRATEIIHLGVTRDARTPYFVPRWINQVPSVLGSRRAEEFNLAFFKAGGIPPMLITVMGGSLAKESKRALDQMLSNQNPASKHQAVVLEVVAGGRMDKQNKVSLDVERFGSDRTQDAMFLKYDERTAKLVRMSFRLPPIFVGDAEAHNFATARASYLVAEAQVFAPERAEFDEVITLKLLRSMPGGQMFRFQSRPLVVDDAEQQIAAVKLGVEQSLLDPDNAVQALNKVVNLDLEFDQVTKDRAAQDKKDVMAMIAAGGKGRQQDQQPPEAPSDGGPPASDQLAKFQKGAVRRQFDNFFVIQGGKALDKGNSRPKAAEPLGGQKPSFAIVREKDGGNTARAVSGTRSAVLQTARNAAERSQDSGLVVIVGRAVGRLKGRTLYRDVAGFQFRETTKADEVSKRLDGLVVLGVDLADSLASGMSGAGPRRELKKNLGLYEGLSVQERSVVDRVMTLRGLGDDREDLMELFGCSAGIIAAQAADQLDVE